MTSYTRRQAGRAAQQGGRLAEGLARLWLRLKLYRIVARRLAGGRGTGLGEIDLVARRGAVVAFVEVKHRADLDGAAWSLGPGQRRRIERAAALFLARRPDLAQCRSRFDVVLIAPGRLPHHIPDAWRPADD